MRYPKFINKDKYIAISALSSGLGEKIPNLELAIENYKKISKGVKEGKSVREKTLRPSSKEQRAKEFMELALDDEVALLINASGGYFCYETLEHIDFEKVASQNKWIAGYSDPSTVLYHLCTKYDLATIYGYNSCFLEEEKLTKYEEQYYNFLQGKNQIQKSSSEYYAFNGFKNPPVRKKAISKSNCKSIEKTGRVIGGCLDVLSSIFYTEYDGFKEFEKKYKNDGIIWYFDIYNMLPEQLYIALLSLKSNKYFENASCIMIGRVFIEKKLHLSYEEAILEALDGYNVLYDLDIGHTKPRFFLVNGALSTVKFDDEKKTVEFKVGEDIAFK